MPPHWDGGCQNVFFITFLSKNPLQYLNKDIQPILGGDGRNPPSPQHIQQNVDELWRAELDNVDTCERSHERVTMFHPEVDPAALPPAPPGI